MAKKLKGIKLDWVELNTVMVSMVKVKEACPPTMFLSREFETVYKKLRTRFLENGKVLGLDKATEAP